MKTSLAAITLALALGGCAGDFDIKEKLATVWGGSEEDEAPREIADLGAGITSEADGDVTEIVLPYERLNNAGSILYALSSDAMKLMDTMVDNELVPETSQIRFALSAPVTDEYGQVQRGKVIALTFTTEELKKVDFGNNEFLPQMMLEFVDTVERPDTRANELIADYCRLDLAKRGATFCANQLL
jgi:hypothetical protein